MFDVMAAIDQWLAENMPIALATVIDTWGSAPRSTGAKMAFNHTGQITGSVSGGCVEGAVFEAGLEVLDSGIPRMLQFGVADEEAWAVGLACGGEIKVFVQPLNAKQYAVLAEELKMNRLASRITLVQGPEDQLGEELLVLSDGRTEGDVERPIREWVQKVLSQILATSPGRPMGKLLTPPIDEVHEEPGSPVPTRADWRYFLEVFPPSPALIIVGGVHIAIPLVDLAKTMGYRTVVIDPRKSFGSEERFPGVDRLYQAWPQDAMPDLEINESTALVMLTHDPKIDDPALEVALASSAFYIGALGSSKTQEKRRSRLKNLGFSEAELGRIHGPVGLDLGGREPAEIALAIMAQITAARYGRLSKVSN